MIEQRNETARRKVTVSELIGKLQELPSDFNVAVKSEFGLNAVNVAVHDEKVRWLSIDYGGDYHPPETLENSEYTLSREVRGLIVLGGYDE